jgi:flagellar biosynthesis chaperone FliJ
MSQAQNTPPTLRAVTTLPDPAPAFEPVRSAVEEWAMEEQAAPVMDFAGTPQPINKNRRIFNWGLIATVIWLALVTAAVAWLLMDKQLQKLDATNILALAGSIFAPLSFIWMMVIAALRAGPLDDERARVDMAIKGFLAPFQSTRDQALLLRETLSSDIDRLASSTQLLDSRVQMMTPPLDAQINRLDEATRRLETAQSLAENSATNLKSILSDISAMAEQVATRLPEAASSVSHASTEVALHGEHLENAAKTLTLVVGSTRDSMAQLLPMLARVTHQTHEASESLSTKLGDLREQAEETNAKLDAAGEAAGSVLENSRRWVDEQIQAVESSIARIEADSSRRIQTLAQEVKALDDDSSIRLTGLLEGLQQQIADSDQRVRSNLTSIKGEWEELLGSADTISMTVGMRLLDAMARARNVANDAVNAARDASQGIIAATENTLVNTQTHVKAAADAALDALQQRASAFATLAHEAQTHARAVREAMDVQTTDNISRLAAQIIDGLNNSAIDVTKILSTDVPESEWRDYISGDRSLFTRKAVRLADRSTEGRIADYVRTDPMTRESVARYLRGFEQLLKLSMGNGQSDMLSLALLSSDWGKLYIVLSRAAERM